MTRTERWKELHKQMQEEVCGMPQDIQLHDASIFIWPDCHIELVQPDGEVVVVKEGTGTAFTHWWEEDELLKPANSEVV